MNHPKPKWSKIKPCLLLCLINLLSLNSIFAQAISKGATISSTADTNKLGKTWAVIVGISKYQNVQGLNYADKDAIAFYDYLVNKKGIDKDHIQLLINEKAIASDIYGALDWLDLSVKENDRVIFYFSGHGDVETKTIHQNGFLLANDAPIAAYMTKGTLSVNYLQDYLETYVAKRKVKDVLLIVDACRAGKLAGGTEGIQITMHALGQNWNNQIIKILSAQEGESSFEDKKWGGGRGVFSYYLVKGLEGLANRNTDSVITTAELAAYLPFAVGDATNSIQNPTVTGNPKTNLFAFNKDLLALAKTMETQTSDGQLLATRGTKDELDPEIANWYNLYRTYLQKGRLIWGEKQTDTINCAKYFYLKLINDRRAKSLLPSLKSSFIANLKHKTEVRLDKYIEGQGFNDEYKEGFKEMLYAKSQIDSTYILYNYLSVRLLFIEAYNTVEPMAAVRLLKKVIQIDPDASYAYNELGWIFDVKLSIGDSAIIYYNKAISLSPKWSITYSRLSNYYLLLKDFKNSAFYAKKASEVDSTNLNFDFLLSQRLKILNEDKKADSILIASESKGKKIIENNQTNPNSYIDLSVLYYLEGNFKKAINLINDAITVDNKNTRAFHALAIIYKTNQRFNLALRNFKIYESLKSDSSLDMFLWYAETYQGLRDYKKAIEFYNKVVLLEPYHARSYINMAYIYLKLNNKDLAKKNCETIIKLLEKIPELCNLQIPSYYREIGQIYHQLGDTLKERDCYEKGIEMLKLFIKNNPKIVYSYSPLIDYYSQIKDYLNAKKVCDTAISVYPEEPSNYYDMACLYSIQNNLNEALRFLNIALQKGLVYYKGIMEDPELNRVRTSSEFKELMRKYFPDKVK